jgi:Putative metal-binding motif
MFSLLWLLLPLIGCDAGLKGSDSTATGIGAPDIDGDGYTGIDDCDEENPSIHIHAEETCDGIDNDCDGRTDDSAADAAQLWYHDGDGDGYGGPATVTACFAPAGSVLLPGDCNDADTGFHPQADEPCDIPVDYNCDGAVQYADSDGDGFAACLECADIHPAAP